MAATRPMLEALLARVRERAAEPRERVSGPAAVPLSSGSDAPPRPLNRVAAAGEEEIEEYDEELIEIIDDGDVESEVERPGLPLELSASAPSIELRRAAPRAAHRSEPAARTAHTPATIRPAAAAQSASPRAVPARAAASRAEPVAFQSESVTRKPSATANVVDAVGSRPELRHTSFVELLDSALDLGS